MIISFHILKCSEVFLAGPYFDYLCHVVDEDLSVSDMAGVQRLLRRFDNRIYRYLADDNFYFHFRDQVCIQLNAAVFFSRALLYAAAHNLSDVLSASNLDSLQIMLPLCIPVS